MAQTLNEIFTFKDKANADNKFYTWRRGAFTGGRTGVPSGQFLRTGELGEGGKKKQGPLGSALNVWDKDPNVVFISWVDPRDLATATGYFPDNAALTKYADGYPLFISGTPEQIEANLVDVGFLPRDRTVANLKWINDVAIKRGDIVAVDGKKVISDRVSAKVRAFAERAMNASRSAASKGGAVLSVTDIDNIILLTANISGADILDINGNPINKDKHGDLDRPVENVFTNRLATIEQAAAVEKKTNIGGYVNVSKYPWGPISYNAEGKEAGPNAQNRPVKYAFTHKGYKYPSGFIRSNNAESVEKLGAEMKAAGGYSFDNASIDSVVAEFKVEIAAFDKKKPSGTKAKASKEKIILPS